MVESKTMDKTILLNFSTMRKCGDCHKYITLEKELDNVAYKGKVLYHVDCLKKKMLSKKGSKLSVGDIDVLVEDLRLDGVSHVEELIYKRHLYGYLMQCYDVVDFSRRVYTKMEQIFLGNFKNMSKKIPPEHLLGMWQKQRIRSILDKNFRALSHEDKFHYDLAIVIKEYPSYMEWLGKKITDDKKIAEQFTEEKPDMKVISSQKVLIEEKVEEDLFSDIDT
jgi:hypothetical protein